MPELNMHVYAQTMEHQSAHIVGTHESLLALRSMLDEVLNKGNSNHDFYSYDGEEYNLRIIQFDKDNKLSLAKPYTDESSRERDPSALWPHQLKLRPSPSPDKNIPPLKSEMLSEGYEPTEDNPA